jgi:hypothetical protein
VEFSTCGIISVLKVSDFEHFGYSDYGDLTYNEETFEWGKHLNSISSKKKFK